MGNLGDNDEEAADKQIAAIVALGGFFTKGKDFGGAFRCRLLGGGWQKKNIVKWSILYSGVPVGSSRILSARVPLSGLSLPLSNLRDPAPAGSLFGQ